MKGISTYSYILEFTPFYKQNKTIKFSEGIFEFSISLFSYNINSEKKAESIDFFSLEYLFAFMFLTKEMLMQEVLFVLRELP